MKRKKFYSGWELAEFCEVARSAVAHWRQTGCPYEQRSTQRFTYDVEDVLAWLAARSESSANWVGYLRQKLAKLEAE